MKMEEKRIKLIKKIAKLLTQEPRIKIILNKERTAIELRNTKKEQRVEIEPKNDGEIKVSSMNQTYKISKNELIEQTDKIIKNSEEKKHLNENQQTVPYLLKTSLNENRSKVKT